MAYWNEQYQNAAPSRDYDGWLDDIEIQSGAAVLDLGCGAGTDLPALLARGAAVTAADLSPEAMHMIEAAFAGQLSGADCFDMREGFPYPDCAFDAVVSDLSLHYFSWQDTQRILHEIARILRRGGRLIARVHSMKNLPADAQRIDRGYYLAYGHPRRYFTVEDICSLLSDWRIEAIEETRALRYGGIKQVIRFTAIQE